MRIVIATPYKIANYGAMLQAWALKTILERMGHSVRYLNCQYMWPGIFGFKRLVMSRSLSAVRNKIRMNNVMRKSIVDIGGFPETDPYESLDQLISNPPKADCYLAGSDQIFGPSYFTNRKRYVPVLLGFGESNVKRITYGASFGTYDCSMLNMNEEIQLLLRRIDMIGIREKSGLGVLREWAGIEGAWTPDPTLLLSEGDYADYFRIEKRSKSVKHVCAYTLGWEGRELVRDAVCREAINEYGAAPDVHYLGGSMSIREWLAEIANAACVVTNSYHGHCFARIFDVPCKLLEFDGRDDWRNERNRDLARVFETNTRDQVSEQGIRYLKENLKI